MVSQAVASSRYMRAEASSDYDASSSDESEDGEVDVLSWSEEYSVRELAMTDFNRTRIMNGVWLSPIDYYNIYHRAISIPPSFCTLQHQLQAPPALHPVNPTSNLPPRATPLNFPPTPTSVQAANLHRTWKVQMESILLPAMKNLARGIVCESNVDGTDPCIRAAKMSLDDVLAELRRPYPWIIQFDYQGKRFAEVEREQTVWEQQRRGREVGHHSGKRESTASVSSRSSEDSALVTSPTESHSTLQTTPSPPPISSPLKLSTYLDDTPPAARSYQQIQHSPPPPPQLLASIPCVPLTADLPPETLGCIKEIWGTARAPIFDCLCTICKRRFTAEQAAEGREAVKSANECAAMELSQQQVDERKLALLRSVQQLDQMNQVLTHIPPIVLPPIKTPSNDSICSPMAVGDDIPLSLAPSVEYNKNPKKRSSAELDDSEPAPDALGGSGGSPKRARRKEGEGDTWAELPKNPIAITTPTAGATRLQDRGGEDSNMDGI